MHVNVDSDSDDKKLGNKDKYKSQCEGLIDIVGMMMDLFGILVYVNINVINHVM